MAGVDKINLYDGVPGGSSGSEARFIVDEVPSMGGHNLYIGGDRDTGHFVCLQRGILEEMAESDVEGVANTLRNVSQGVANHHMDEKGIPYSELGLALSQARITELKNHVSYLESASRG